jgi:glutathione S-transferase
MIRIHNFPRGLRGVRAGWVCEELGVAYEFAPVSYPPSAEYKALNPLGTVPFLEDGAVAISESLAIMLHLAETHGPGGLLPPIGDPARATVLQWLMFGEASIGAGLNPLLTARFGAPDDDKRNWSVRTLEQRTEQFVRHVEATLGDRAFLVGGDLTLADISVATSLSLWRGPLGGAVPDSLTGYLDRLTTRPAYQAAVRAQA